ncbi:MAG: sensor histidine kinase, partial [Bacteroidota bacterium]
GADKLNVQLFENQSKLILIVEDNGKVIQQPSADGVGILNIKNRLKTFNGRFNLEPNGDSGTTATASIPV